MNSILKIIIGIIILLSVFSFAFFEYNKYQSRIAAVPPSPTPSVGELPASISLEEDNQIKELAENFVSIHETYQKGDLSHLNELKKIMTEKYQEEITRYVEEKKLSSMEIKEYISYAGIPKQIDFVYSDIGSANVLVVFEHNTFYGASVYIDGTLTAVDQAGKKSTELLKRETVNKQAELLIIKDNGLWKVDSIKIKPL